ncbi:MAG TPA: ATP-binding protein [Pyrinomonadaceae bacterium]|jgi:PAS domain S-box-containing protein|nr:ATP-binding protein [Pyrinomonadaceae bacterium]
MNETGTRDTLLNAAVRDWMQELAAQGIIATDSQLNVVEWNNWMETHTGKRGSEVIGKNLLDLFPELTERRLYRHYKWALEGQVRVLSQALHGYLISMPAVSAEHGFGEMQQAVRISPLSHDGRVIGTLTIIEDVTERVAREAELQAQIEARTRLLASEKLARSEAERANRLKDEFLATISHELRNPLNAIMGWAHMMRLGNLTPANMERAVETIYRNAKSQGQLVADLLDVSRIISGKLRLDMRTVDPINIVNAAIDSIRPASDAKSIRLQTILDPAAGPISGDADRLQQIVWNLLTNAVKFTPKGGKIQVTVQRVNTHIEIVVSDSGVGISKEFLPYVFDRFRQADASTTRIHGGLGLGLSIVHQLVDLHGGTVAVASEGEGKGATFTITLPFVGVVVGQKEDEAAHPTQHDETISFEGLPSLHGLKVLVVDDEPDTRELISEVLKECGSEVITSRSAVEALEALEQYKPDILISDLGMPDEDGYSLISKIRALPAERGGQIPAAALTAYARAEDRMRVLRSGFQFHLPKPIDSAELVTVVASLAGRAFKS